MQIEFQIEFYSRQSLSYQRAQTPVGAKEQTQAQEQAGTGPAVRSRVSDPSSQIPVSRSQFPNPRPRFQAPDSNPRSQFQRPGHGFQMIPAPNEKQNDRNDPAPKKHATAQTPKAERNPPGNKSDPAEQANQQRQPAAPKGVDTSAGFLFLLYRAVKF